MQLTTRKEERPRGRGAHVVTTPTGQRHVYVVRANGELATPPFLVERGQRLAAVQRAGEQLLDLVDPVQLRLVAS